MPAKRRRATLGALLLGAAALAGPAGLAGCAEAPPLETPEELEAMRAEWEAQAAADAPEAEPAAQPDPSAPADDDYTIDVPPPYPVTEPADPVYDAPVGTSGEEGGDDGRTGGEKIVRIEKAGRAGHPRTLFEASVEAKKERKSAPQARIRIDNDNLDEFQDGNVTLSGASADPGPEEAADESAEGEDDSSAEPLRGEEYWRSTVLDLRVRLRTAVDELAELDERADELRRSFYAQDDPYVRDGEIKPAWDRTLDRVEETRRDILQLSRELDATLQEGRQAGALPGWLREGAELEPEPEELPRERDGREHQPSEPSVIEIEPQEPPV